MSPHIIILAAGLGKRMFSDTPKVLHQLAGQPLLTRVINTALQLNPETIHVIYGHGSEQVRQTLADFPVNWVQQTEQLGTGHAVLQALPHLPTDGPVLILYGDVPLIQANTLKKLIERAEQSQCLSLLVADLDNPYGLGRILRDSEGNIQAIIEEKDATDEQRNITEIYSGICCVHANDLARWLPQLTNHNAQNEYYFTEIIPMALQEKQAIHSIKPQYLYEIQGINNRLQLQQLERAWQQQQAENLLLAGVGIADAARIDLRGELHCGKDVFIDINCIFLGNVHLEDGVRIDGHCVLNNVRIGRNSHILPHSVLESSEVGENCSIGPFARLRTGTRLDASCKIGNFVETKQAVFGQNSKASHLSYLGDVNIGNDVNIGAGTITCNYDGVNKHQTIIEDGAFIGSDTQLVAPVTVGAHATIGAGSTIRANAPAGELTLTPSTQKTVPGWKRPEKTTKKD